MRPGPKYLNSDSVSVLIRTSCTTHLSLWKKTRRVFFISFSLTTTLLSQLNKWCQVFRINYRLTTPLGEIGHLILISDASNATNQSYEIQVSLHSTPFYSILLHFTPFYSNSLQFTAKQWIGWNEKDKLPMWFVFETPSFFFRAPSISTAFSLVYLAQLKIEKKKKKKKNSTYSTASYTQYHSPSNGSNRISM